MDDKDVTTWRSPISARWFMPPTRGRLTLPPPIEGSCMEELAERLGRPWPWNCVKPRDSSSSKREAREGIWRWLASSAITSAGRAWRVVHGAVPRFRGICCCMKLPPMGSVEGRVLGQMHRVGPLVVQSRNLALQGVPSLQRWPLVLSQYLGCRGEKGKEV
jgi:hypothetical protein